MNLRCFIGPFTLVILLASCAPQVEPAQAPGGADPSRPSAETVDAPRIPVSSQRRVLQTLATNLDQDAAEEQFIILQDKTNLSLPLIVQVADYDEARKTYYLAWEGTVLASASQPFSVDLDDLLGDHGREVLIQGLDESGRPTLDVLRAVPTSGNLGFAYQTIFSQATSGTIRVEHPMRPQSYSTGVNSDLAATIVVEEQNPRSKDPSDMVRRTLSWLFQRGQYVLTNEERYQRTLTGDAALEKVFTEDNGALEAFLSGPWVKVVVDKSGLLILFLDPKSREITFASSRAQEVYRWEATSRSGRNSLYVVGSNDLINLIKLQMSLAISAADTLEVNAQDNPIWSGTYKKLDPSAALALARQGTESLKQDNPPVGLYKNDKGDEFDFMVPEIHLKLDGVSLSGSMAVYHLGEDTILQIRIPARPGFPASSRAYAIVAKQENSTSRVVRTLRLQSGVLSAKGWVSDQSDPLRLEQVEGNTSSQ